MKLLIEIRDGNAAFNEGPNGTEFARILRDLANRIDDRDIEDDFLRPLFDSNGNRVGRAMVGGSRHERGTEG